MNGTTAELHHPPFVFVEQTQQWTRLHNFSEPGRELRLLACFPEGGEAAFCDLFVQDSVGQPPFFAADLEEANPQLPELPGDEDRRARQQLNRQLDHYRRFREEVFAETEQAANHHSYDD